MNDRTDEIARMLAVSLDLPGNALDDGMNPLVDLRKVVAALVQIESVGTGGSHGESDASKLPPECRPGAKYRSFGKLYHVRAIVDGQAVIRWWSPRKGWQYIVEGPIHFHVYKDNVTWL